MEELAYICVNCKKRVIKEECEDVVSYLVMDRNGIYKPTCSIECAEIIKQRHIDDVQKILDKVKDTRIEIMDI